MDPSLRAARRFAQHADTPAVLLVGVYRRQNAGRAFKLMQNLPEGSTALWWGLDGVAPALADITLGEGPGPRLALLNRLLAAARDEEAWLMIADDDVAFTRGAVRDLATIAVAAGLDFCQPAHAWRSKVNHPSTRARPWTIARRTAFVEQGPLFLMNPSARTALTPFPEDMGMGWGIEARWANAASTHGLVTGIVDAVRIRHLDPAGKAYDVALERDREASELQQAGLAGWPELQAADDRIGLIRPLLRRHSPW